jgi:hypothetical protein
MKTVFGGVYAPSTIGTLLRELSFGHTNQLESVLRNHVTRARACFSFSTAGADPDSRLPATSGVNSSAAVPTRPATIGVYAGSIGLPVPETTA